MNNNMPVWEWEDAVNFIAERCDIDKDTIEKVLELEMDYERSIGVIVEENELVNKLPLLTTYPIDINADGIYDEDVEPLYRWEIETIMKLFNKLYDSCKGKHITPDIYADFFNKEIQPYKEYFINDSEFDGSIYEKILPKNMSTYWSYKIDKTLNWDESFKSNNIGISVISVLEGKYLNKDKRMEDYRHVIGDDK